MTLSRPTIYPIKEIFRGRRFIITQFCFKIGQKQKLHWAQGKINPIRHPIIPIKANIQWHIVSFLCKNISQIGVLFNGIQSEKIRTFHWLIRYRFRTDSEQIVQQLNESVMYQPWSGAI